MTSLFNNCGFTLIELLVVVLTIGILTALAVPQYQKAVDRARVSQAVQLISSLEKATELFILESPGLTTFNLLNKNSPYELSIDIPCEYNEGGACLINGENTAVDILQDGGADIYTYYDYGENYITTYANRQTDGSWRHICGYLDKSRGKTICTGLQGYEAIEDFEI